MKAKDNKQRESNQLRNQMLKIMNVKGYDSETEEKASLQL